MLYLELEYVGPGCWGGLVYNKSEALGTSVQVRELRRLMRSHLMMDLKKKNISCSIPKRNLSHKIYNEWHYSGE
jgi:hypothetical protein